MISNGINSHSSIICDICGSEVSSKYYLKKHQTTIKCIKVKELKEIESKNQSLDKKREDTLKCILCNQLFTKRNNLERHLYSKKHRESMNINEYKVKLEKSEKKLEEYEKKMEEIKKEYERKIENIRKDNDKNKDKIIDKLIAKTNNNNTVINKSKNYYSNIVNNIIKEPLRLDEKVIDEQIKHLDINYVLEDERGLCDFFVDRIARNKDKELLIVCKNLSNKTVIYMKEDGQIVHDVGAHDLVDNLKTVYAPKVMKKIKEIIAEETKKISTDFNDTSFKSKKNKKKCIENKNIIKELLKSLESRGGRLGIEFVAHLVMRSHFPKNNEINPHRAKKDKPMNKLESLSERQLIKKKLDKKLQFRAKDRAKQEKLGIDPNEKLSKEERENCEDILKDIPVD